MEITDAGIDGGTAFDWGRTSEDYARFRDIYPPEFYERIIRLGLCTKGQHVLDLGTGTGVLPRNMARYGARWTGTDISPEQIAQARKLSQGLVNVDYLVSAAEDVDFPDETFDVITACQCFWYFDHPRIMPNLWRMLKPGGSLLVLYMAWLPDDDPIAGASERLILKYSPQWSGAGEWMHPIEIPACYDAHFSRVLHEEWPLDVHFTRESWNGRVKACRGIGASLPPERIADWEAEHRALLEAIAPEKFDIRHYAALAWLRKR
ncbi:Methylase involved in ubiquinone/menaquinone biosynthesis [Bifidobacterium sp. DSM 109960]|uniref:Methylase involved in ubiquinone/menaquinone biosynthesis n=1 Tax=Bifidobacterium erythrocebi TaxID=2675325 RepID=A0A7Y0HTK1_9BIFI|nr:class I SAM-dependent methyltransferase [Bifidobacterium sp. DSM 109960]NMM96270.1 Methylase involved in ubiquinone/menaquinone biosynthesis [Bifidobacterium sp. DSM 109960]